MSRDRSTEPSGFPRMGSRLIVYVIYDRRGGVEQFVREALDGLRPHAQRLMVVVNGELARNARDHLVRVADDVLVRANEGLDIWAHKAALDHLGDAIGDFDEVLLTNDTWFGPVGGLGGVFARMDPVAVDLWGMNDHPGVESIDAARGEAVSPHLQSFWIAARRRVVASETWAAYWRDLPPMHGYDDAVHKHELRFAAHFAERGFRAVAAYSSKDYDTENPSFFEAETLLEDEDPVLKRKPFHLWPPLMVHFAAIGRWTMNAAERRGSERALMMRTLVRSSPLRDLHTNLSMLSILPGSGAAFDRLRPPRVLVVAHLESLDGVADALRCVESIPGVCRLVLTVDTSALASEVADAVASEHLRPDIRVVDGVGDALSALLGDCADLVRRDDHDLIAAVTCPAGRGDDVEDARLFLELLQSSAHAADVLALFQEEPDLGVAFLPPSRVGDTLSREPGGSERSHVEELASSLGISVPIDGLALLAPTASLIARPEALALLVSAGDGDRERSTPKRLYGLLVAYAAAELGFHSRTVLTAARAVAAHTALESAVGAFDSLVRGTLPEKIDLLHRAGPARTLGRLDVLRMYARLRHPGLIRRARSLCAAVRALRPVARSSR